MTTLRQWLSVWTEWLLVGLGIGCLGTYACATIDARRFQAEQVAMFARDLDARAVVTVKRGGLVGMLDVPRLRLSTPVIQGDDDSTLKRAVGHLPDTPFPWEDGNSAIAGHRDGLFRPLKDIKVGDEIRFRTSRDVLRYRVIATSIVQPDDLSVLQARTGRTLTLITCHPFTFVGTAPRRFVIHAERP